MTADTTSQTINVKPGFYVLEISRGASDIPFVEMSVDCADQLQSSFTIPALKCARFFLRARTNLTLRFSALEGLSVGLEYPKPSDLIAMLRGRHYQPHVSVQFSDGSYLVFLVQLSGPNWKQLARMLRLLNEFGLTADNPALPVALGMRKDIKEELEDAESDLIVEGAAPSLAVVLHLFYHDLWPEFELFLRRIRYPFHLIVTTHQANGDLVAQIHKSFPAAEIHVAENRGRDVGPFLQLLHNGRLDNFDLILKLHSKKSGNTVDQAFFGDVWRRTNLFDLIGSDHQVRRIVSLFEKNPRLGAVGSSYFRVPSSKFTEDVAWGGNKAKTLDLAARLGIANHEFKLDYFAGTMFWIRRSMLQPLLDLGITIDDFPPENGSLDGDLQHAVERAVGALVAKSGGSMQGVQFDHLREKGVPSISPETPASTDR